MSEHSTTSETSLNLVGVESEVHVRCDGLAAAADGRGTTGMLLAAVAEHYASLADGEGVPPCGDLNDSQGVFLPNGARLYPDHMYLEYSTPECSKTADAVAAVRAGDHLVRWAAAKAQEASEGNGQIVAVRNNRDYAENAHSYAAHVNVRMSRHGFERVFSDRQVLHGFVVPLFVSLPVICGSGSIDTDNGRSGFAIWQRATFLKTLIGLQTTFDRPLVNTRDEALAADPERFARFHVIAFDANVAEVAEYCKLGLLRLLCAAIDAGRIELSMELAESIEAIRTVARDPFASLRLASGTTITPVEILIAYQAMFAKLHKRGVFDGRVPDAGGILARSGQVLEQLKKDPMGLIGVLDWPTKLAWLGQFRKQHGLGWSDPRVKWQDIQYHCLNNGRTPLVAYRRITSDEQVKSLMTQPPTGSRAEVRSAIIRRFGREILGMDWHWMACRDGTTAYLLPDDPPEGAVQSAECARTLKDLADSLDMDSMSVTPVVVIPLAACNGSKTEAETLTEALKEV